MKRAITKVRKELKIQKRKLIDILHEMELKESDMMITYEDWDFTDKGMEFQEKMNLVNSQIDELDNIITELHCY